MATLADVIRQRRSTGQSRTKSLMGSLKDKFLEAIDPRQFLNQTGVMSALFPSLKKYTAGTSRESGKSDILKKSVELIGSNLSLNQNQLDRIAVNTEIIAKNSLSLPGMSRDMNVMRQNIIRLVKSLDVAPTNKADAFFKKSSEREAEFESQFGKIQKKQKQESLEPKPESFVSSILGLIRKIITPILLVFKTILGTVLSTIKSVLGLIVAPLMGIITGAFTSLAFLLTGFVGTLLKKIVGLLGVIKSTTFLYSLLGKFLLSPAGLALLALGLGFLAAEREKKLHEYYTKLEGRREELLTKQLTSPLDTTERVELEGIDNILKNARTGFRVVTQYGKGKLDQTLPEQQARFYQDMLRDPKNRESAEKDLEERFGITDKHQEVIDTFIHNYYEKPREEVKASGFRTLRDAVNLINTPSTENEMTGNMGTTPMGVTGQNRTSPTEPMGGNFGQNRTSPTEPMGANQGSLLSQGFRNLMLSRTTNENPQAVLFKNQNNNEKNQTEIVQLPTVYNDLFITYITQSETN
jgi:hypothetical protein